MNTLGDRIKAERKAKNLTQEELGKLVGVGKSSVSQWESGLTKNMDGTNMVLTAKALGVSPDWLATGEGSKRIHDTSGAMVGSDAVIKPLIDAEEHGFLPIQHAALIVKAGNDGFTVDHIDDMRQPLFFREDWYRDNGYKPEKMLAVSVSGESMWPKMSPGDVVIINTASTQPKDGKVFVVNYEGEVVIKRLARDAGQWWLASDNPDKQRYPNKLCAGDYCLVIGEVVYLQTNSI